MYKIVERAMQKKRLINPVFYFLQHIIWTTFPREPGGARRRIQEVTPRCQPQLSPQCPVPTIWRCGLCLTFTVLLPPCFDVKVRNGHFCLVPLYDLSMRWILRMKPLNWLTLAYFNVLFSSQLPKEMSGCEEPPAQRLLGNGRGVRVTEITARHDDPRVEVPLSPAMLVRPC